MDIMDTPLSSVLQTAEICGEEDMKFISKVTNLQSKQKVLVNKLLDASDHCQEMISMILSSTKTLDLVQKMVSANTKELNLMRKITELNDKDLDLLRKVTQLCDGKKHFICKFMDWYLTDETLDFPCSCVQKKGANHVGKGGTCTARNHNDVMGGIHTVVSSCTSQQGKSSEKFRTHTTNHGTSREILDKPCGENVPSLHKPDVCTENVSVTKEVNLNEKNTSSTKYRPVETAQLLHPAVTIKGLSYENLCPGSNESSEEVSGSCVSHTEHNDLGFQQKITKHLDDAREKGNRTLTAPVLCGTSDTQDSIKGTCEEELLNTKSALPLCENMEVQEKQRLVVGRDHNYKKSCTKECVITTVGMKQAKTCLLPQQNVDTNMREQINNELLQGNMSDAVTSPLSSVESNGLQLQNSKQNDFRFPVRERTETQLHVLRLVCSKPDEFVLKDCYVRLENIAHVLRGKKAINLKDLRSPQGNGMKKNISENESSDVADSSIEGSSNVPLNTKGKKYTSQRHYGISNTLLSTSRKRHTALRCYTNNAKKRLQTSKYVGLQVIQTNESIGLTTNENITVDQELLAGSTNLVKGSDNCERLECSLKRIQVATSYEPKGDSRAVQDSDAVAKGMMMVEGHSEAEDLGSHKKKTSSGFSVNTANSNYKNLSSKDLSTVQVACSEQVLEDSCLTGRYKHQRRVPEIRNREFMFSEQGLYQSVGNVQKGNAEFLGKVAFHADSAGKCVKETSNMWLRVKPEFNERNGMLWGRLSGEAETAVRVKENILGIQLQPSSMDEVGSLKWAQFTTYIDHPYAGANFMCAQ